MYLGYQNGKIKFYTEQPLDQAFYNLDEVVETQDEYVLNGDEYVLKDEAWEEEQAQKERERIAKLTCTKRVFALMLQELGITYTMLKQLIATNEQAQLEWDLCVELERQNPLLDVMAMQLGITSEQLDGLFRYANGEITIEQFREIPTVSEMEIVEEPVVDNSEGTTEENSVIDEVAQGEDVKNSEE
jgi:hypothetical protein